VEYTLSVADGARAVALTRALEAYNARNTPLNGPQFLQKLLDGQLDSLVASYVVTTVTPLAFLQRFTTEERVAIRTAAKSSAALEDYLKMLDAATEVNLTHTVTVAGVQALEAGGLIAAGRGAEILAL
jgi:hypothetical protein